MHRRPLAPRLVGWLLALAGGAAAVPFSLGCGGSDVRAPFPDITVNDVSADDLGLAGPSSGDETLEEESEPVAPPPPPPPRMVVGESTPLPGASPTLRLTAPAQGATVRTGNVSVRLDLRNWELASPAGPHVHLIVDNEPYIAVRDVSGPIDLNALVEANLGHPLAEGTHVLRAFPSRGHHESVKDAGAFASVVFHYRHATEGFSFDRSAPLLTYSRPKGCNLASDRVLVDFFVSNVTLAPDGYRVRWTLDGEGGELTTWAPHYLEHLTEGEHSLGLTLIGPDGAEVPGPFNATTRTFTVAATCG